MTKQNPFSVRDEKPDDLHENNGRDDVPDCNTVVEEDLDGSTVREPVQGLTPQPPFGGFSP